MTPDPSRQQIELTACPDAIAIRVVQRVAELPDRTSPVDWPDAMLVTSAELQFIVTDEINNAAALRASVTREEQQKNVGTADDEIPRCVYCAHRGHGIGGCIVKAGVQTPSESHRYVIDGLDAEIKQLRAQVTDLEAALAQRHHAISK